MSAGRRPREDRVIAILTLQIAARFTLGKFKELLQPKRLSDAGR